MLEFEYKNNSKVHEGSSHCKCVFALDLAHRSFAAKVDTHPTQRRKLEDLSVVAFCRKSMKGLHVVILCQVALFAFAATSTTCSQEILRRLRMGRICEDCLRVRKPTNTNRRNRMKSDELEWISDDFGSNDQNQLRLRYTIIIADRCTVVLT